MKRAFVSLYIVVYEYMKYNISINFISKVLLVITTLFIIFAPLLNIIRMDVLRGTIVLFGRYYFINEFYVLWLFLLFILLAFIFVSMVFGRVYCGFVCPQTILSQIFEGLFGFIKKRAGGFSKPAIYAAVLIFMAVLSLFIGFNLIAYFIPPFLVVKHAFLEPDYLTPYIWVIAGFIAFLIIFDMILLRHKYCIYACPYGFIQFLFNDSGTLRILYRPVNNSMCKDCTDCTDSCFMKIDPRKKALQVQCVNCGYCIDSCKERFDSKNEKGKNLFYSFGLDEDKRNKAKNRPFFYKAAIALFLLLASFLIFFFKFSNYHYLNQSIFNINQNYFTHNPKMFGNKYKLIAENGSNETKRLKIKALSSGFKLHFLTKSEFKIEPHSSLTLYPVLYILKNETKENFKKGPYPLTFQIINSKNTIISEKNTVFFITKIFNNKK